MQNINTQNNLQANNFSFIVNRLPEISWDVNSVNIPTVTFGAAILPTRFKNVSLPGEKLDYTTLDISFIVDKKLTNYREIINWMNGQAFPESSEQYTELKNSIHKQLSDITLHIITPNGNPVIEFMFTDAFPTSINGFTMSTTDSNVVTCGVSFEFNLMKIREINQDF